MIAIGCDHAACGLKQAVLAYLDEHSIPYIDCGPEEGVPCDYPDMAEKVCGYITSGEAEKAILLCGTGIGMGMAANKHRGIRAAVCSDTFSARMTRMHNDANMLAMGARVVGVDLGRMIAEIFLTTDYEGGRHQHRVDQIMAIEAGEDLTNL